MLGSRLRIVLGLMKALHKSSLLWRAAWDLEDEINILAAKFSFFRNGSDVLFSFCNFFSRSGLWKFLNDCMCKGVKLIVPSTMVQSMPFSQSGIPACIETLMELICQVLSVCSLTCKQMITADFAAESRLSCKYRCRWSRSLGCRAYIAKRLPGSKFTVYQAQYQTKECHIQNKFVY